MWKTLRYYWIAARGYRLQPWNSPYLQWRFETFLGQEAAISTPKNFSISPGSTRDKLASFVDWAATRRRLMRRRA